MPLTPEETQIEDEDEKSAALSRVAAAAKDYLTERPLLALAVAAGAGLLIGRMLF